MKGRFELWPSIDLINGKPVRLYQGDFDQQTDYAQSLEELAGIFSRFATGIHVVDLDGAKTGQIVNFDAISAIVAAAKIPVEVGGGIRTLSDIRALLTLGVKRVVIGTSAIRDPEFLKAAIAEFGPKKIVVGADIKNGLVAVNAWRDHSGITIGEFITNLSQEIKIETVIVTDISRDGTLTGPPVELYQALMLVFPDISIIASGGVSKLQDIADLQQAGVMGVIFGKAFYEGKVKPEQILDFSQ